MIMRLFAFPLLRKFLSALSALLMTFLIFAVLPIAQSGMFAEIKPRKEYSRIDLAPRKDFTTKIAAEKALGGGMPPSTSGAGASAGRDLRALPNISMSSDYGVASASLSGVGDVFGAESFGGGTFIDLQNSDFEVKAFEFAQLDNIPRRVKAGKSEYPRHLYSRGIEGEVRLSLFINSDGSVEVERVISSTNGDFEDAAVSAAESQRYEIPMRGGSPARARFELLIPFKIIR